MANNNFIRDPSLFLFFKINGWYKNKFSIIVRSISIRVMSRQVTSWHVTLRRICLGKNKIFLYKIYATVKCLFINLNNPNFHKILIIIFIQSALHRPKFIWKNSNINLYVYVIGMYMYIVRVGQEESLYELMRKKELLKLVQAVGYERRKL